MLCPDLDRYIYEARRYFPNSKLVVGTNGLLLTKCSNHIMQAMTDTGAMFAISLYPPTLNQIDEIKRYLNQKGIAARYPGTTKIDMFFRRYDLSGDNDPNMSYKFCVSRYCTTVYEGKLGACYFPVVAENYNKIFRDKFSVEDDLVDLHDDRLTKAALIKYLRTPLKACRYCGSQRYEEWGVIGRKSCQNDWIL